MMIQSFIRAGAFRAALLVCLGLAPLATYAESDSAEPARWAPADALFYLGLTEVEKIFEDYQQSPDFKLLTDPAFRDSSAESAMIAMFIEKLQQRVAALLKTEPDQLRLPFRGPLAIYGNAAPGAKSEDAEIVLVARIGDAELMRRYYDTILTRFKQQGGGKFATESVGEYTIDTFVADAPKPESEDGKSDTDPEAPNPEDALDESGLDPEALAARVEKSLDEVFSGDNLPARLAACVAGDRFIAARSAEEIRAVLRRDKQGENLAEGDDHKLLVREFKPTGRIRFYLNLPRLFRIAEEQMKDDPAERENLERLGLSAFRGVIGHMNYDPRQGESRMEALLQMTSERSGLAGLLSFDNRPTAPPAAVTNAMQSYLMLNVSIPKLLTEIEKMVRQFDPAGADQMRESLEKVPDPSDPDKQINLRAEFLQHLREPLTFRLGFSRSGGPQSARLLVSSGHSDRSAINRMLARFAGMLTQRESRGAQCYDIAMIQMTLAAGADELFFGTAAAVDAALESAGGDALAESAPYRRLAEHLAEKSWLMMYIDQRAMSEALIETMTKQGEEEPSFTPSAMLTEAMRESQLGPAGGDREKARRLLRYKGQAAFTLTTTERGILVRAAALDGKE